MCANSVCCLLLCISLQSLHVDIGNWTKTEPPRGPSISADACHGAHRYQHPVSVCETHVTKKHLSPVCEEAAQTLPELPSLTLHPHSVLFIFKLEDRLL